jgi:hypothetical protein
VLNSMMIFRASALALLLGSSAAAQDGIEVQRLDALDPLEVGLPDAGLGSTLWDGTNAEMARIVLAGLPDADGEGYRSIAVGELARIVLSSGGYPPADARGATDLAVMRVDRLLAAAGAHDAYDLLERTPNLNQSRDLSRQHVELAFALGSDDRACRTADSLLDGRDLPAWQRVRAFCFALNGQAAAAELTAELARSGGEDADFDALLYAITLGTDLERDISLDSGLELAMARRLGLENLSSSVSADSPRWVRRLIMGAPPALDIEMLSPTEILSAADAETGDARTVLLEAALAQGADREVAAQAMSRLLSDARASGEFIAASQFYGREIHSLPLTDETLAAGYEIALAAVVYGDVATAREWRHGLVNGPVRLPEPVGPTVLGEADGLTPSALLERVEPLEVEAPIIEAEWVAPPAEQILELDLIIAVASDRMVGIDAVTLLMEWQNLHGAESTAELLAMNRLGASSPAGLRQAVLRAPSGRNSAAVAAMDSAVRAGAQAESALLAIRVLHELDDTAAVDTLARALAALDRADLREAALYILVERLVERAL